MSLVLTNPAGLWALAALPAIVALHLFVLRGPVRQVSSVALWGGPQHVVREGKTRQRLPITAPLLLELFAATLLALLVAGLQVRKDTVQLRQIGILIDGSVSMNGAGAIDQTLTHIEQLPADARLSLFLSGPVTERVATRLSVSEAREQIASLSPSAPHHRLGGAIETLNAAGFASDQILVFSDDGEMDHPRLVRVGRAEPNLGIVNATWQQGFVGLLVERFGGTTESAKVAVRFDGESQSPLEVDFRRRSVAAVRLRPPRFVDQISFELPADTFTNDNQVTLFRPSSGSINVRVRHKNKAIRRAVRRAVNAAPSLEMNRAPADLVVSDDSFEGGA